MTSTTAHHAETATAPESNAPTPTAPAAETTGDPVAAFVRLSAELTGFDAYALHGTGQVEAHLATVERQVGRDYLMGLLAGTADTGNLGPRVRMAVLGAITKLWYGGAWMALPASIYAALNLIADGQLAPNITYVPSVEAYRQGLMWKAFHGHPMGANPPGFGSWSEPPETAPAPERAR